MAIERMKRVTALVPADEREGFTAWLHGRAVLHLTQIDEKLPASYQPTILASQRAVAALASYEQVLSFCETWGGGAKPFLENIFSARTVARMSDLEAAAKRLDPEALTATMVALRSRRDGAIQKLATIDKEIERLAPFRDSEVVLGRLRAMRRVRVELARLSQRAQEEIERSAPLTLQCERLERDLFWFACPAGDDTIDQVLSALGAAREEIPQLDIPVSERLDALYLARRRQQEELGEAEAGSRAFAAKAGDVELAYAYWQSETARIDAVKAMLGSARISVTHGYLPARELAVFTEEVRTRFSGEVFAEDPGPKENVPVRLRVHPLLKPVTLLVNMFGLPDYYSIDPTPYIALTFLAFFGICYSDAIYGIALAGLAIALMVKFRRNEKLRGFFQLFLYCGISTAIAGALLGTWAGDLPNEEYLGENNFLYRLREAIPYFDALAGAQMALLGAIGIGIANQYFGILLRVVRDLRRRDWMGAFGDGGMWFLYLTGLIILVATLITPVPEAVKSAGVWLFGVGAVGLVLTQGRGEKGLFAKVLVGVVSLYGIMGTYGASSFIGDVLSYARLMALGLTTGIVGQSFNVLGKITSDVPVIGSALFVIVVVFGHTFNFAMSIIGAFVHAVRLILLEFFGRFYETGGAAFKPFGFSSARVEVTGGGTQ